MGEKQKATAKNANKGEEKKISDAITDEEQIQVKEQQRAKFEKTQQVQQQQQ